MSNISRTSPFLRYVQGTAVFPPNTLHESTLTLLDQIDDRPATEILNALLMHGRIDGHIGLTAESTWYALLKEFISYRGREFDAGPDAEQRAVDLLRIMVRQPHELAWAELEPYILEHIDELSGWDRSWTRQRAEAHNVFRTEHGEYFFKDGRGVVVQIIGEKSLPEVRLDYLSDSIERPYGCVRRILTVFSLFAISEDFARKPESYPQSLIMVLPEPGETMLTPRWQLVQLFRARGSSWHPSNALCDPGWLSEQILAQLTDLFGDPRTGFVSEFMGRENKLDEDCGMQIDCVLETDLVINGTDETYFQFEGRTFRWIGGTGASKTTLSVGVKDNNDFDAASESMNRLLSALAWEHRVPIRKGAGAAGPRRNLPFIWGPWRSGGLGISSSGLLSTYTPGSEHRRRALAFYREGLNSASVFYKFFNLWKILELAVPSESARRSWLSSTLPQLQRSRLRINEISATNPDVADYLYESCRCAITHVWRKPYVDPDDPTDSARISADLDILDELVRIAMQVLIK